MSVAAGARTTPREAATDEAPSDRPRARAGDDWFFSAFVTVAALLPRLYVAIAWTREPVWDGHYYDFGARRIAAGLGYSDGTTRWHPWCHWPVGYSGFLAGVYRLFGEGPRVATVAGAVIGALTVLAVHRFARAWLSPARARLAAVLCAIHPGLILYSALVMSEPLAALVLLLAGLLALRAEGRARWNAALYGLVLGLGTLLRPTFVAHAPVLGLFSLDLRERRAALRRAALAGLAATSVALAVVAPWTARNCRVMDRCTFVSTNGGWNLAIGAMPRATGRFETLHGTDGCPVVTGQVQQDACWRDAALGWIRAEPRRWLALVPKKLAYTFDHESYPVEYLHEADPDRWPEPRRVAARGLLTLAHRLLLTLAAFAVVAFAKPSRRTLAQVGAFLAVAALAALAWMRDDSPFWPLAVAIVAIGALPLPGAPPKGPAWRFVAYSLATVIGTHAIFFGEDRYHVVVTPLLCVLAAAALRRPRASRG